MEADYKNLLLRVMQTGERSTTRNGYTFSLINQRLKINLSNLPDNFPCITSRKIYAKNFINEFLWFINGETNISRFKENNVKIWDLWADEDGELGPIYGYQLRQFNNTIDQLKTIIIRISNLPKSRRNIISLWNPAQLSQMSLPPCYYSFQFIKRNNGLNMVVNMRSCDLLIGLPYDVCVFSLFLYLIANETGNKPGKLFINIADAHIYEDHLEQAKKYLVSKSYPLPNIHFKGKLDDFLNGAGEIFLNDYICGPHININIKK